MNELNQKVYDLAKKYDACTPALMVIPSLTVEGMLNLFMDKIDYSFCADFLNADFLKENASKAQLNDAGIYVDDHGIVVIDPIKFVAIGSSSGCVMCSEFSANQLFVKDKAVIAIDAVDSSFTVIDCFAHSQLNITAKDNANVYISVYGQSQVDYESYGNAKVKVVYKYTDKY